MQLSPATARELQDALEEIAKDIAALQEKAAAIRKVLGKPDFSLTPNMQRAVGAWSESWNEGFRPSASLAGLFAQPAGAGISAAIPEKYNGLTVRQVVQQKLKEMPGAKAADVTQVLREEGYATPGTTRFSHRIYNEIWRMEKDGLVLKDDEGGFTLLEET